MGDIANTSGRFSNLGAPGETQKGGPLAASKATVPYIIFAIFLNTFLIACNVL